MIKLPSFVRRRYYQVGAVITTEYMGLVNAYRWRLSYVTVWFGVLYSKRRVGDFSSQKEAFEAMDHLRQPAHTASPRR